MADGAWILQADPKQWDLARYARDVRGNRAPDDVRWPAHDADLQVGDRVFLYSSGDERTAGVLALARVTGPVEEGEEELPQYRKGPAASHGGPQPRVPLHIEEVLPKPLYKVKMEWDPELKGSAFLSSEDNAPMQLSAAEAARIEELGSKLEARQKR